MKSGKWKVEGMLENYIIIPQERIKGVKNSKDQLIHKEGKLNLVEYKRWHILNRNKRGDK